MGSRGELYSRRAFTGDGKITFFFNLKLNHRDELYLNIVESRKADAGYRRNSIMVFAEDIKVFRRFLERAFGYLRENRPWESRMPTEGGRRSYLFSVKTGRSGDFRLYICEEMDESANFRDFSHDSVMVRLQSLQDIEPQLEKIWAFLGDKKKRGSRSENAAVESGADTRGSGKRVKRVVKKRRPAAEEGGGN